MKDQIAVFMVLLLGAVSIFSVTNLTNKITSLEDENNKLIQTIQEQEESLRDCFKIKIEHIEKCLKGSDEEAMKKIYNGSYGN